MNALRNLKYRFSFILLMTSGFIFSCSQEQNEDFLANSIKDSEFRNIEITVSMDKELLSRCSSYTSSVENDYSDTDYCSQMYGDSHTLQMIISYDKEIIFNDTLMLQGEIKSLPNNYYISKIYKTLESNLSMQLRIPKIYEPSKIYITLLSYLDVRGNSNKSYFNPNLYNANEIKIFNHPYSVGCNYFVQQNLSDTNSWENIKTIFTLKRINSEIIIFTTKERFGIPSAYSLSDFYKTLNDETSIEKFLDKEYANSNIKKIGNEFYTYTPSNDEVRLVEDLTGVMNYNVSIYSPIVKYKNKNYYMFGSLNMLSTISPSYPKTKDGREIRYLSLIFDETHRNLTSPDQSHYDGHLHVHWNTLPLPDGGMQANKRYIYILSDSYPMWENKINIDSFKTKSWDEDIHNQCSVSLDFELIEQDMDDPLPFEIIDSVK